MEGTRIHIGTYFQATTTCHGSIVVGGCKYHLDVMLTKDVKYFLFVYLILLSQTLKLL